MAPGRPLTDEDRERVRELHAGGKSRNEIARAIGRAQSTVSKLAAEMGLDFDRSRTRAATAAKQDDAKARRAALAVTLLGLAEQEAAEFNQPATLHSFGGKDHTHNSVTVERPVARDRRDMAATIGLLLDKHARLLDMDADQHGLTAVDAWLAAMTGTDT